MKQQLRTRAALLTLALAACGGNNAANTTTTTTTTTTTSGNERSNTVVAQDDVSEVAAPNDLVAVIRATSVRAVAARVARYGFLTESDATGKATELIAQMLGNEPLSRLVRTERPMDGAVVFTGGRPSFVSSFAVPIPSETVRRLGSGFRSRSVGNGVIELTPQRDEQQSGPRDPEDEESDALVCFVSPTPTPTEGRLTCTTGASSALESVTPFLARTLTRRETRQDAIQATVFPNALRAMMGGELTRGYDEADRAIDSNLANSNARPLNHPDVRTPLVRLAHDMVANNRALWNETSGINLTLSFDDQRVRLASSFDVHSATGSAMRALIEGSRAAPAIPEQFLQRIPTDAGLIVTGSWGHQMLAPYGGPLTEIAVALARSEARLPAPMVTQLQTVLTHLFENDLSNVTGVFGDSTNHLASVGVTRFSDDAHATQFVTDGRTAISILRNPAFSRAVETFLRQADAPRMNIDWRQVRELPARGLPAGAFAFQLPDFPTLAQQARSGAPTTGRRAPAVPPVQFLLVPEGAYVTVVLGRDVRATWTQISARAGAPLDLALHGARAGALTLSLVPAGLANLMASLGDADAARTASAVRTVVTRMPDRGATPAILRMSNAEVDGDQRFSLEIEVQVSSLTGLAAAMR
ncbi:MAG: hypothetical protein U0269_14555 [Polyangiales bacterium]